MKLSDKVILASACVDGAIVIAVMLCLLKLVTWGSAEDIESAVDFHKKEATRVTHMLAECMNGKALYDKTHNVAYFCGKVLEMKL